MRFAALSGMTMVALAGGVASAQNLLPNASFEDAGPGFIILDQWTNFTTNAVVANDGDEVVENSGVFVPAVDGNRMVKMFGAFPAPGAQGDTVLSLDFNNDGEEDYLPTTAGTTYHFSGNAYCSAADPMIPFGDYTPEDPGNFVLQGSFFILVVNFRDADGNNIPSVDTTGDGVPDDGLVITLFDPEDRTNFPYDTWVPYEGEVTAPAGTVEAQHIFVYGTFSPVTGSVFIDDISAEEVSGSCSPADITGDGSLNNTDINAFVNAFLSMDPVADINSDGSWNNTDINLFVNAFLAGGC